MDYAHSLEQSGDYAAAALPLMKERGIPVNPNNFTVWYNYVSGDFPELRRALDILLDTNQEFTDARNAAVYRSFCGGPYDAIPLHLIADKVEAELATVLATLDQASRRAADYGKTLELASDKVANAKRVEELKQVIGHVLTQTRAMSQQSREVERQLTQSWSEVGQLKEELENARREAMTDALTGLANRKMFDYALRQAAMEAMENGENLSLLFLDIDHFKSFNDMHGHHVGDQVLKLLASVLRESIKGQDTSARYGGEEFAVILPRTELSAASKLAENIRRRVGSKTVINRKTGTELGRFTVSIGVAGFVLGEPLRRLIERADKALYVAKHKGRNRVVSEDEIPMEMSAFGQ